MTAPDESGERAIPPSQGLAGSAPHCSKRESRAAMSDDEYWDDVFGMNINPLDYYDPDEDFPDLPETHELNKPCTECGEFICGYDWNGRPMYHRQKEEDN